VFYDLMGLIHARLKDRLRTEKAVELVFLFNAVYLTKTITVWCTIC